MFLSKMYKPAIVILMLFTQACSFSTKKNSIVNNTESNKTIKILDSTNNPSAFKDIILSNENINNDGSDNTLCMSSKISTRLPLFLLTGPFNSFTSIYGQYLCDSLNNDFVNNKYVAVIQPLDDPQEAINYLRKDDLTTDSNIPFVADFLITRTDYLFEKVHNNSGPLKNQPTLDVVMFLNGNYLFLWGNTKYGAIELSDFVKKFSSKNPKKSLVIAVTNSFAKKLFTKVVLANTWATTIDFVSLEDVKNLKYNIKKYDLIAYAGPVIHNNILQNIQDCDKKFIPLTIAEEIILNTQKSNPEISSSDITSYYSKEDLINVAALMDSSDKSKIINNDTAINNNKPQEEQFCKHENTNIPFVNDQKYCENYEECVFGKSVFNFNIKPVEEILNVKGKLININSIKIHSLGIRNVLVATRNTNVYKVFDLASAFFAKYDYIKSNYITYDMRKFSIKDLITGNLYKNEFKYHYGILNYKSYIDKNYKSMGNEVDIPKIISSNLKSINYPAIFGPEPPNSKVENEINTNYKEEAIFKRKEEVLKSLKFIVDSLKMELSTIDNSKKDNKELYNTKLIPDLNITNSNFNDDLNYLPFSNLSLGK